MAETSNPSDPIDSFSKEKDPTGARKRAYQLSLGRTQEEEPAAAEAAPKAMDEATKNQLSLEALQRMRKQAAGVQGAQKETAGARSAFGFDE